MRHRRGRHHRDRQAGQEGRRGQGGQTKAAAAADDGAKGLTAKECSAKYQAAKAAGTLNGAKWNDFRKTECAAGATAAAEPAKATTKAAAAADDGAKGLTAKECSAKYQAAKDCRHAQRREMERLPQDRMRRRRIRGSKPAKATTKAAADSSGKGLSMADCSAKYQAAKSANTLGGKKWNDFRKAECGAGADDDDTVPAPSEASYKADPEAPTAVAPKGVKFPTAISKKYASETPGKARMHTCLEQYYALTRTPMR